MSTATMSIIVWCIIAQTKNSSSWMVFCPYLLRKGLVSSFPPSWYLILAGSVVKECHVFDSLQTGHLPGVIDKTQYASRAVNTIGVREDMLERVVYISQRVGCRDYDMVRGVKRCPGSNVFLSSHIYVETPRQATI